MNAQVLGMVETNSSATVCEICEEQPLTDEHKHSPFATVCKACADQIQREEQEAYYRACMR